MHILNTLDAKTIVMVIVVVLGVLLLFKGMKTPPRGGDGTNSGNGNNTGAGNHGYNNGGTNYQQTQNQSYGQNNNQQYNGNNNGNQQNGQRF